MSKDKIVVGKITPPGMIGKYIDLSNNRKVWVSKDEECVFMKFQNHGQQVHISVSHEAAAALLDLLHDITRN